MRIDALAIFVVAFLLWALNNPYQGLQHDGDIYALLAAHWLYPENFSRDLFFQYGSQSDFSLFAPLYGLLIKEVGLDAASRLVVFSGGLLWVGALGWLVGQTLGWTLIGRFALLFGVTLMLNYSPNTATFLLNENFATARSWAMPLGLFAVGLSIAGYSLGAVGVALLSSALHPLIGIWPLALLVGVRLGMARSVVVALLIVIAVLMIGAMDLPYPRLRQIRGEWLEYVFDIAGDVVFKPIGDNRLPIYLAWLACLLAGTRAGTPALRATYGAMALLLVSGTMLAVSVRYAFPTEILAQAQLWRVLWLAIPLAGVAVCDVIQRTLNQSTSASLLLGLTAALISLNASLLLWVPLGLCALAWLSPDRLTSLEAILAMRRRWLIVCNVVAWFLAGPGMLEDLNIAGNRLLEPWWNDPTPWVHGLVAGSFWLLPLVLACLFRWYWPRFVIVTAAVCLLLPVLANWDRRSEVRRLEEARYLKEAVRHPFVKHILAGQSVYWPGLEKKVWLELRTASYAGVREGVGRVFSEQRYYELTRRNRLIEQSTSPLAICTDPALDWIVVGRALPRSAEAVEGSAFLHSCTRVRATGLEESA